MLFLCEGQFDAEIQFNHWLMLPRTFGKCELRQGLIHLPMFWEQRALLWNVIFHNKKNWTFPETPHIRKCISKPLKFNIPTFSLEVVSSWLVSFSSRFHLVLPCTFVEVYRDHTHFWGCYYCWFTYHLSPSPGALHLQISRFQASALWPWLGIQPSSAVKVQRQFLRKDTSVHPDSYMFIISGLPALQGKLTLFFITLRQTCSLHVSAQM